MRSPDLKALCSTHSPRYRGLLGGPPRILYSLRRAVPARTRWRTGPPPLVGSLRRRAPPRRYGRR